MPFITCHFLNYLTRIRPDESAAAAAEGAFHFNPFDAGRTFARLAAREELPGRVASQELIIYLFCLSWASQTRGYYPRSRAQESKLTARGYALAGTLLCDSNWNAVCSRQANSSGRYWNNLCLPLKPIKAVICSDSEHRTRSHGEKKTVRLMESISNEKSERAGDSG